MPVANETLIDRRVALCREGLNPTAICKVQSGWVVLGDVQFLRGYSLLLPDPVVADLNSLDRHGRSTFMYEATVVGDALLELTDSYRINYEVLGNTEAALHAHIFPRYRSEPDELRRHPAWFYDWASAPKFDEARDRPLMDQIRKYLTDAGIVELR